MPTVSLTTIRAVKDQPITYQPLMLVRVTFPTGGSPRTITAASNATPIAITTSGSHGWTTGDRVTIYGVAGNLDANSTWTITVTGATTFTLDNSVGSGAYTAGGKVFKNDTLRLCTHGLTVTDGGFQYGSQDWLPRILNQDMAATQAMSEQGIDFTPSVSLRLADPDKFIWLNYGQAKGFKGATLEMVFSMWQVDTSTFSSDSATKFIGVCADLQDGDEETITLTAKSKLDLSNVSHPTIRLQKRCPWNFPSSIQERQDGADLVDSDFYRCGYSPDATGSNARGNLNGGSAYTKCDKTKEECVARGMYTTDGSARITGRFGGVQWAPPQSFVSRSYISGKFEEITNSSNEAKYGDFIPVVYGTQRMEPLVVNTTGDGNLTKMEVILCVGEIDYIYEVTVNDVRIPHVNDDTEFMSSVKENGNTTTGFWKTVNKGDRNGAPNPDTLYDSKGDPYGSLAVIGIVVTRKVAEANSIPKVVVHFRGPKVRVYSAPGAYTFEYSESPAWHLMDVLVQSNLRYAELDVASFVTASGKQATSINYSNQFGATGSHSRYTSSLTLRQRRSASDLIRGIRNSSKMSLAPNFSVGGKLQVMVRETLASQQGSSDPDSNNTSPITSKLVDGTTANGYVKYAFTEAHYIKSGKKSSFRLFSRSDAPPNKISAQFQNRDNRHATEAVTIIDSEDVARIGQELSTVTFQVDGVDNFDQLYRCVNTFLAEGYRGNSRLSSSGLLIGDTGGTVVVEFDTTFRAIHLRVGDIVSVSHQAWGISAQLFRITKIQPSTNFATVKITAHWHNDLWYLDTFGQTVDARWRPSHRNRLERPSYPWSPNGTAFLSGDPWGTVNTRSFILGQSTETLADSSSLQKLSITGALPINSFPSEPEPPFVNQQGSTASTGGTIAGDQTYFVAVCAKDTVGSTFKLSAPSRLCVIAVPSGTSTNTITVTGLQWGTGAVGYVVFAGTDPNVLTYQADGDTTPSSVTLTSFNERSWGMPDSEYDKNRYRVKRVLHAGVFGAEVVSVTSTTITLAVLSGSAAGFTTNQWAGYDLSLLALKDETGELPIANWTIGSNTSNVLTISAGPDPTTIPRPSGGTGLSVGDVVVMRSKPTIGSDATGNYLQDAGWINNLNTLAEPYAVANVTDSSGLIKITTTAATPWLTGDRVYVQGVGGVTAANNLWVVTKIDSTNFTLNGSTFSGTYTSGGQCNQMIEGFINDQQKGRIIRFIQGPGKGTFVKIKSNTQVSGPVERIYIEGSWPFTPTSASRYIIEEGAWQSIVDTESFTNDSYQTNVTSDVNVDNYKNQVLLVQALTVDGGDTESVEYASPIREIYVFGGAGTIGFTGAVYLNVDGNLAIGSDLAPIVFLSKDAKAVSIRAEAKTAPTGADLIMELYFDATLITTLTMAAGTSFIEATAPQISASPTILSDKRITLNITQVGSTVTGADLAVIIYI